MCDYLEAVTDGRIKRLRIHIPPRHMKSRIVSVFWPIWMWLRSPSFRWLSYSYSADLATQHALDSRRVLASDWFRSLWPELVLTGDQNTKSHYENNHGGSRRAGSMRGGITGFGGDGIIIDDPHDASGAESDAERNETLEAYRLGVSTRLNDPKQGFIVLVMQRLHEQDLAGYLEEEEPDAWASVVFPAEYDGERRRTPLGEYDWRYKEGELLWPERYGPVEIANLKKSLKGYGEAGQLQQRPVSRRGGMIDVAWLKVLPAKPAGVLWVRAWDFAGTEGGGDHTAGLLVGEDEEGRIYLADGIYGQWGPGEVELVLHQTAMIDGQDIPIRIPQDPAQAGKSQVFQMVTRLLRGWTVWAELNNGSKITRATGWVSQARVGNVYLVAGPWVSDFMGEARMFPRGKKDDYIDAVSAGFDELTKRGGGGAGSGLSKDDYERFSGREPQSTGDALDRYLRDPKNDRREGGKGGLRWNRGRT
jgi:predicted phage terminase large subunit-like protein